jgi:hypothetical protein
MMDTTTLQAIEDGAIPVMTTEAYAGRLAVSPALSEDGSLEQRIAGLRALMLREAATYGELLPSVRLSEAELSSYRAKMGGDAALEGALDRILVYKEDLTGYVDFLFLLRAEVYRALADRAALAQQDVDDAALEVFSRLALKYGYAGVRKITGRDPGEVFVDSVRRGELQYDHFFRGQLFEVVTEPGYIIHGHFAHVLQWLYYSWRLDGECPVPGGVNQAMAGIYRKIPEVTECAMFRRLSDTFNSPVQLVLRKGEPPNFPAMAVNSRGAPASLSDPGTVTRLFEMAFYTSLDAARPVVLEPMHVMVLRPGPEEILALYVPETEDEKRAWVERSAALRSAR